MDTPRTLTVIECHQLLDALIPKEATHTQHAKGVRNYTMAVLMLEAGLRVGEVVQLRGSDLYFNDKPVTCITISPEVAKNNKERIIPVSQKLSNALTQHWAYKNTQNRTHGDYYVFCPFDRYEPLTTRQVERIIRAAAMRGIGRPVHPHILRHTFASRVMRKANVRVVQELLGHESLTSTQIYTHPNSDDLKKAIDDIDEPGQSLVGDDEQQ